MGSKNGKPVLTEEQAEALAASSGLDATQVREQFDAFVAEHPNGKMKKKDFREMMQKEIDSKLKILLLKIFKRLNAWEASIRRFFYFSILNSIMRIYDTNNDGVIDFVEFMVVFYIMSDGTPQEVLSKIFRVFDVNSDGTINKKELTRLIKDMYGLINSDNPEKASKEFIAASAFTEMDKDADGKITNEEFVNACLGQEQFSKMLALKIIDIFVEDDA